MKKQSPIFLILSTILSFGVLAYLVYFIQNIAQEQVTQVESKIEILRKLNDVNHATDKYSFEHLTSMSKENKQSLYQQNFYNKLSQESILLLDNFLNSSINLYLASNITQFSLNNRPIDTKGIEDYNDNLNLLKNAYSTNINNYLNNKELFKKNLTNTDYKELNQAFQEFSKHVDKVFEYINIHFDEINTSLNQYVRFVTKTEETGKRLYETNFDLIINSLKKQQNNYDDIKNIFLISIAILALVLLLNLIFFIKRNKDFQFELDKFSKKIEILSVTDSLTKLYNKKSFQTTFPRQINANKRRKEGGVLIICDIDNFTLYSKSFGHEKSDEAIKKVAEALQSILKRADDYCFRLGDKEFGILANGIDEAQGLTLAKKLKTSVEKLEIDFIENSASRYLSISLSVTYYRGIKDINYSEIYDLATKTLRVAKIKGKNKICTYNIDKYGKNFYEYNTVEH